MQSITQQNKDIISKHNRKVALRGYYPGSAVIVENFMTYNTNISALMAYFCRIVMIFVEHRVKNILRNTKFLPQWTDFVGIGLVKVGNKPEQSKTDTFNNLKPPQLFYDWRMLTGSFEFY